MTDDDKTARVRRRRLSSQGQRLVRFVDDTVRKGLRADLDEDRARRAEAIADGRSDSEPPPVMRNTGVALDSAVSAIVAYIKGIEARRVAESMRDLRAQLNGLRSENTKLRDQLSMLRKATPTKLAEAIETIATLRQELAHVRTELADIRKGPA